MVFISQIRRFMKTFQSNTLMSSLENKVTSKLSQIRNRCQRSSRCSVIPTMSWLVRIKWRCHRRCQRRRKCVFKVQMVNNLLRIKFNRKRTTTRWCSTILRNLLLKIVLSAAKRRSNYNFPLKISKKLMKCSRNSWIAWNQIWEETFKRRRDTFISW